MLNLMPALVSSAVRLAIWSSCKQRMGVKKIPTRKRTSSAAAKEQEHKDVSLTCDGRAQTLPGSARAVIIWSCYDGFLHLHAGAGHKSIYHLRCFGSNRSARLGASRAKNGIVVS